VVRLALEQAARALADRYGAAPGNDVDAVLADASVNAVLVASSTCSGVTVWPCLMPATGVSEVAE
jgi:cytosine/adenosine deaminase-related metal-dependent hydrolase